MPEPLRDLDAALSRVADRWDEGRTERTLEGLHDKQHRRSVRRRAAWSGATVAVAVLAVVAWVRPWDGTDSQPLAADGFSRHVQLADGSQVWLRGAESRVRVVEETPQRVTLELDMGAARFDVTHREGRVFRVRSGVVTVEVLGTRFEVEQHADRTRVEVSRGRVAVTWPQGRAELAAGEADWFPHDPADPDAASGPPTLQLGAATRASDAAQSAGASDPRRRNTSKSHVPGKSSAERAQPIAASPIPVTPAKTADRSRPATVDPKQKAWREAAEQGEFEHAYKLLAGSQSPVADDVEELLLAADSARLSGHPEAALPFLRKVVERHAKDSRAPLAAFTLGGVLMQQLGQPREAEAAYAKARELSLNASLAEDALARQVEAAHRAGDSPRARSLAREYMERYPSGRRLHAVQRFGGLAR
jgi:transmembrane sensor